MRCSKIMLLGAALVLACLTGRTMAQSVVSIVGSPHDLNHVLGGTSGVFVTNGEVCKPCHTPHQAPYAGGTLLWNHQVDMSKSYTMYTVVNPTNNSQSANPVLDNTSRLCLSCHDGAIAIDSYGRNGDGSLMQSGTTLIGTLTTHATSGKGWTGGYAIAGAGNDLSADHPIGIGYPGVTNSGGTLTFTPGTPNAFNSPLTGTNFLSGGVAGGPGVKLVKLPDGRVGVGCTSCHEPHDKSLYFQRMANNNSALCLTCHIK